jgi:hypothetical protein
MKEQDHSNRRGRLLELLKLAEPIWKDEDHPEPQAGAADWVRQLRAESEARFQRIQQQRDREGRQTGII